MAKTVPLSTAPRVGSGKGEARSLRREGRVPAIAYGRDLETPHPVSVDANDLFHAFNTDAGTNAILALQLDGDTQLAIARDIQRHPVKRHLVHVDFVTVSRDVRIEVDVPISLTGEAAGAVEGGLVDQALHNLSVSVLPLEVPDEISVDVTDMNVGDVTRVADLDLPRGVEPLLDPDTPVVSIYYETVEVPEPGEEGIEEVEEGEEAEAEAAAEKAEAGEGESEAGDSEAGERGE
jgi:large subunit ribosomal protein L25